MEQVTRSPEMLEFVVENPKTVTYAENKKTTPPLDQRP